MLTAAGSGYSQCAGLAVTRWREDVTRDHWGTYVFLRDVAERAVWSAAYQPTGVEADSYEVTFSEDRAESSPARRRDHHHARGPGLARGRRRDSPRHAHEPRDAASERSS